MVDSFLHVRQAVTPTRMLSVGAERSFERPDHLATEEPMEIRVGGPGQAAAPIAVTMRTPSHDFELAAGFLKTEGLVSSRDEIDSVRYCVQSDDTGLEAKAEQQYNIVTVRLRHTFDTEQPRRNFITNSSCGICGTTSIEQITRQCHPLGNGPLVTRSTITALPHRLREAQSVFEQTGGLHAAGLFDADGNLTCLREDVGRHNALDKLVGYGLLQDILPFSTHVLMLSGRVSFEMVQKAAQAGIAVLGAVSAPSSLAVESARALGMTLAAFIRGEEFNIYSHPERIDLENWEQ